jgi:hypothetical protein
MKRTTVYFESELEVLLKLERRHFAPVAAALSLQLVPE